MGIETSVEIEVDKRAFLVFQLVECRCFLENSSQIGKLVVPPDLLKSKFFALLLVPRVIEVQRAGVFRTVLFSLGLLGLEFRGLSGLRDNSFLFRLIQFCRRHEYRKLRQTVLGNLVAGIDKDLGIEVRIGVIRYLAQLEGVFVTVIGDDVDVGGAIGRLGFHADKARGDMTAVKDPIHRVAGEDVGDLLFDGQDNQC
jgi:hypothetical protein